MTTESIQNAGQLDDAPSHIGERIDTSQGGTCTTVRNEACHLLSCANEQIRKNPVPIVAGAAVVGLAIGYLLMSGKDAPDTRSSLLTDLPDQAGDFLSNTMATLGNLKFW